MRLGHRQELLEPKTIQQIKMVQIGHYYIIIINLPGNAWKEKFDTKIQMIEKDIFYFITYI